MGKQKKLQVFLSPTSREEIEAYKRDDSRFKVAIGGFSLNHRLVTPKAFFRGVLCLLAGILIFLGLLALTGNLHPGS